LKNCVTLGTITMHQTRAGKKKALEGGGGMQMLQDSVDSKKFNCLGNSIKSEA